MSENFRTRRQSENRKKTIGVVFMLFLARSSVFIRDIMISATFGAGAISDIFLIAFRIPQFFKQFLAEGSVNTAFMPDFSKKLVHGNENANKYAYSSFYSMAIILFILTVFVEIFTSFFIYIFCSLENTHQYFDILISWTRVNFFYVFFIGIASLFNAIMSSHGLLSFSFIGQILLNVSMVVIMSNMCLKSDLLDIGYYLCYTVFFSSLGYMIINSFAVKKYNFHVFKLQKLSIKDGTKFLKNLAYSMIWVGISQLNSVIDMFFAGSLETGTISCVYYADRISRFPLTLITMPLTLLFLPKLSKAIESKSRKLEFMKNDLVSKGLMFSMPIAIVVLLFAYSICHGVFYLIPTMLFGKTNFEYSSITNVSSMLQIFSSALPALILFKIASLMCFSYEKQKFLLYSGITSIGTNCILNSILIKTMGAIGIAIGTISSSWLGLCIMLFLLIQQKFIDIRVIKLNLILHTFIGVAVYSLMKLMKFYFPYKEDLISLVIHLSFALLSFGFYFILQYFLTKIFLTKYLKNLVNN